MSATILPQEEPSFKVDLQKASLVIIPTAYLVVRFVLYTTETGRLRIQRQAWQLTSAANVYDFGHVALFARRKR